MSANKNRYGTEYRYFVCVGRHQKRTTCDQSYMFIETVEALVEDYYATIGLTPDRSAALREHIHNGLSAKRADAELERRRQHILLTQLDHQRRKLLQAHYDDAIAADLFSSEQRRINQEMDAANARLQALDQVFTDIEDTLDRALKLGQNGHRAYLAAPSHVRRLMNQAFFTKLYISDEDQVRSDLAEPFALLLGDELANEAAAALAQEAKNPPPDTGTTGSTCASEPHTQGVKGSNKALLVDLSGQLSNPQPALEALADLDIGLASGTSPEEAHPPDRIPRATPRTSRPLRPAQVDALIAGYRSGKTMKQFAAEFGIDRRTVPLHLRRANVPVRKPGLDQAEAIEAAHLYEAGWSSGRLAVRYDVSADTVLTELGKAGVAIRPRRGGPRSL